MSSGVVAVGEPDRSAGHVRRRAAEGRTRQPGRVPGVFAVPGDGPEQTADAGRVRGAAGAAVAVRRHRAGRWLGGRPPRTLPDGRRRHRRGGRVRRPDDQLARRLSPVRVRHDVVREEFRAARQAVLRGNEPSDREQDGRADRPFRRHQRRPSHGRRHRVPRRRGRRPLLLRGSGRQRHHDRGQRQFLRARILSGGQRDDVPEDRKKGHRKQQPETLTQSTASDITLFIDFVRHPIY